MKLDEAKKVLKTNGYGYRLNEEINQDRIDVMWEYMREHNDDYQPYDMEELDEILGENCEPSQAIRYAFNGYDYNPNKDVSKEPFNPNREYFAFNGYGNLVSIDKYYLEEYLDDYSDYQFKDEDENEDE